MKKLSLEMLRLTSDEVLQRGQMKKITGGYGGQSYSCTCHGSVGQWTGYYSGYLEVAQAIGYWCASGNGQCSSI